MTFKALLSKETDSGFVLDLENISLDFLQKKDVLLKIEYSSINYKDVLSAFGNKRVTKVYPHIPGIDAVATVFESESPLFKKGDIVVSLGFGFGSSEFGAYSEYAYASSKEIIKIPDGLDKKTIAILGTAGFTAMQGILKLKKHLKENDDVIVSGSSGGVGSIACFLLSSLNYKVHAISSKKSFFKTLEELGVSEIILREDLDLDNEKPLLEGKYKAGYDTVGGRVLTHILKMISYDGACAMCGNVSGQTFESSVFPFILRGLSLYGIDCVNLDLESKRKVWNSFLEIKNLERLESLCKEISLEECASFLESSKNFKNYGRTIVRL